MFGSNRGPQKGSPTGGPEIGDPHFKSGTVVAKLRTVVTPNL